MKSKFIKIRIEVSQRTFIIEYNNILFGIHKLKFVTEGNKVESIDIKVNDFVEYDAYSFKKK